MPDELTRGDTQLAFGVFLSMVTDESHHRRFVNPGELDTNSHHTDRYANLVAVDVAAVGEVLHQRGWRKAFTVAEMVDNWAWLVAEVENGYDDSVDEYTNDLYCRNWLHEAWLLLDDHLILAWSPQIKALDDRFRAATINDDGQAVAQFHRISGFATTTMWWWRRHPRILVGDLGRSLRSAGAAD
jgi:uncharacterized protein YerC